MNKTCPGSGEGEDGQSQATRLKNKEQKHTAIHWWVLSLHFITVTRSHHLHLVHHKRTDVRKEGAMGPLDSLLRGLTRWWGSPAWGPGWGPPFTARTHTRTDIFAEPYIIHLIYRKYIYLYYTQAVTLQEGQAPRRGLGTGERGGSYRGAALGDGRTSPSSHKLLRGELPLRAP